MFGELGAAVVDGFYNYVLLHSSHSCRSYTQNNLVADKSLARPPSWCIFFMSIIFRFLLFLFIYIYIVLVLLELWHQIGYIYFKIFYCSRFFLPGLAKKLSAPLYKLKIQYVHRSAYSRPSFPYEFEHSSSFSEMSLQLSRQKEACRKAHLKISAYRYKKKNLNPL